jgi:DNA-binding MarR family transcriptional regulator
VKTDKPIYAPLPARAVGDDKLSAEDFRVLGVIAAHDRLGANGVGCYASVSRLAQLTNAHVKSVSRTISSLAQRGYIEINPNPMDKRRHVYRIRYTEMDAALMAAARKEIGNKPATEMGEIGNNLAGFLGKIGNKPTGKIEQSQGVAECNIFSETVNTSREAKNTSGEAAPDGAKKGALEQGAGKSVGALLGMIERSMKAGKMNAGQGEAWLAWLDNQISDGGLEYSSPEYQRAFRLHEELQVVLDADAA